MARLELGYLPYFENFPLFDPKYADLRVYADPRKSAVFGFDSPQHLDAQEGVTEFWLNLDGRRKLHTVPGIQYAASGPDELTNMTFSFFGWYQIHPQFGKCFFIEITRQFPGSPSMCGWVAEKWLHAYTNNHIGGGNTYMTYNVPYILTEYDTNPAIPVLPYYLVTATSTTEEQDAYWANMFAYLNSSGEISTSGFVYSTSETPTVENGTVVESTPSDGVLSGVITTLPTEEEYYVSSYVETPEGEYVYSTPVRLVFTGNRFIVGRNLDGTISVPPCTLTAGTGGWGSFMSFIPESMVYLDGAFYSFNKGDLYKHDSGNPNDFYGVVTASTIKTVINDNPEERKLLKAISINGDDAWNISMITDTGQTGAVNNDMFEKKEGVYYGYVRAMEGLPTVSITEADARTVVGIGDLLSFADETTYFIIDFDASKVSIPESLSVGDYIYGDDDGTQIWIGTYEGIASEEIEGRLRLVVTKSDPLIDMSDVLFVYAIKHRGAERTGVLGQVFIIDMTLTPTSATTELFSIGAEVMRSYP